ncbi:hypothetical protein ACFHW0_25940 [Micromonospora sp. LOL_025]|uniref:WXG100-like domain-containing protein n=1 Tax=Micromonospora sp. LOL_025 TaxID=3345413 RepID=UPI003A887FE0
MPIPQPRSDFGLWPAVSGRIGGWIATDEDAVGELGELWTRAGPVFSDALSRGGRPAGFVGPVEVEDWPDQAGFDWTTRRLTLGADLETQDGQLRAIGGHVTAFADDVRYAKQAIVQTIEDNLEAYATLVTAPAGADAGLREAFVSEIARAINTFLDEMAALIAGRPIGVTAQAGRPAVDVDPDDLDGFGAEEAADWAGVASATLGVAALGAGAVFPPAALVLGGLALVTGSYTAAQHTSEALADPSWGNTATAVGDVASIVPGVGGLTRGVAGLTDAVGSTAPGWVDVATGLGAGQYAAEAGAGLQAATNLLPQVPTVIDLSTPGGQGELQDAGSASTGVYGGSRAFEVLDSLGRVR